MLWKSNKLARAVGPALSGLCLILAAPCVQNAPVGAVSFLGRELAISGGSAAAQGRTAVQLKRYRNDQWKFALDIPARWHAFPPGPARLPDEVSSSYEVIRFADSKPGDQTLMIIYRMPHDPAVAPAQTVKGIQSSLAKSGFSNFVTGETRIGTRSVVTLDFEKPHPGGKTWRTRSYFIVDGALMYVLGFGATERQAAFGLYDRVAKSFTFDASAT